MNYPLINMVILLLLLLMIVSLSGWVLIKSSLWTGPSHDRRFRVLETDRDHDRRRITNLEENSSIQFRGLTDSLDGLHGEISKLSSAIALFASLHSRVSSVETRMVDFEQSQQSFVDLGCGFEGCLRNRAKMEPKG